MELKDIITLIIAAIGAVLGVLNTFCPWLTNRITLKIDVSDVPIDESEPNLTRLEIVIRNRSNAPAQISDIGMIHRDKSRHSLLNHSGIGSEFPPKLVSWDVIHFPLSPENELKLDLGSGPVKKVYVQTLCGKTFTKSSKYLSKYKGLT